MSKRNSRCLLLFVGIFTIGLIQDLMNWGIIWQVMVQETGLEQKTDNLRYIPMSVLELDD